MGTGEALNELAGVGEFGRYPERAARLVEAVQLIRALWTGERVTFEGRWFRSTVEARLYDVPDAPPPIYMAASGPNSAYSAGRCGDGWIGAAKDFSTPALLEAFARGAADSGRDPDALPKLAETFVVVGGLAEAEEAATLWRFTADPWNPDLLYEPNPVEIQRISEERFPLEQVCATWPISTDPQVHVDALQAQIDAGLTPYVHSGQHDQLRVIELYGAHVLPALRPRAR